MNITIFILALLLSAGGWIVRLKSLFRQKGFDPALVTYADPLAALSFFGYRLLLLIGLILTVLQAGPGWSLEFIIWLIIISALTHLVMLLAFGRQQTQATAYFALAALAALGLLHNHALAGLAIIFCQEAFLILWRQTRQRRYDKWVARLAAKINATYAAVAATMPEGDWRWVLHIAVTESIARPKLVRLAERVYFKIKRPEYISTGLMQIRDRHPISDQESLRRGAAIIRDLLPQMPANASHAQKITWLARHYNGSGSYGQYLHATSRGLALFHHEVSRQTHVLTSDS